jgi:AAA family ATP:ADP antiporter
MQKANEFGTLRKYFWPIKSHEHNQIAPIIIMFFLVTSVYHLLRTMKGTLMITLKGSGANVVPFLKIGGVLPFAILITYIYTLLSSRFKRSTVFLIIISSFIIYFNLFLWVLYPNSQSLEAVKFTNWLAENVFVSKGTSGLLIVIRHWNISLFYVLSELWSSLVLSTLLWGFVNEITKLSKAKRFYAVYSVAINSAGVAVGFFVPWLQSLPLPVFSLYDYDKQWVFYQVVLVVIFSFLILIIYYKTNMEVAKSNLEIDHADDNNSKKEKSKTSLLNSLKVLLSSKYLLYLALIVFSYNMMFNVTDIAWLHRAKISFPISKDFNSYVLKITFLNGVIATCGGFITSAVIRRFGWTKSAISTPVVWLITGILFYGAIDLEYNDFFIDLAYYISNPSLLILAFGSLHIIMGRGFKYTIFDTTKEMAYIPLNENTKRQSKAVIDGVISRIGKAAGSLFIILALYIFEDLAIIIDYIKWLLLVLITFWIYSVYRVSKERKNLSDELK